MKALAAFQASVAALPGSVSISAVMIAVTQMRATDGSRQPMSNPDWQTSIGQSPCIGWAQDKIVRTNGRGPNGAGKSTLLR